MTLSLETSRLIIRQFRDSDLETFLAYRNDPEVARYQGWELPFAADLAREFIGHMQAATPFHQENPFSINGWYQMAVELSGTGETLGDVALTFDSSQNCARIGYTIAQPHWRQGYASEAVSALLTYLFGELGVHRIIADCSPANTGSVRILEKNGFRREAHYVESYRNAAGIWEDEYQYGLLDREWKVS